MITSVQTLLLAMSQVLKTLLPVLGGIAILVFLWGLAVFILNSGNEKAAEEGKSRMIWGVVGIFVIFSMWGLITVFQQDFIGSSPAYSIPVKSKTLPQSSSPAPANSDTGSDSLDNFDTACGGLPCR